MGTGYTRNDTSNNIADGNVINASDLDGEFDAIQAAFNATTGHSHDGTTGEGPQIGTGGIADNAVTLGTKTSGNYVAAGAVSGVGLSGSASSEGATFTVTSNATSANTASTIVARDASGNFSAGQISGTSFASSGDMTFGDNDKAVFGAGSDLQVYHDGLNSYVDEQGSGGLLIRGTNLNLTDSAGVRFLRGESGGPTRFYHQGTEVLTSTSSGIDVTGTVTADGLTVDGDISLTGDITSSTTMDIGPNAFGAGVNLKRGNGAVNGLSLTSGGDVSFYDSLGTTQGLFWDASTQRLGLGDTAPPSVLSVYQNDAVVDSTGGITIEQDGTGDARLRFLLTATQGYTVGIDNSDSDKFKIGTSDDLSTNNLFTITSGGDVGIGVSTPSGKLHLSESGATNEAATIFSLDGYDSTFGANLAKSSGTYTTPAVSLSGGGWEYRPVNSLNNHGDMIYLSAPDTNTSASTPLERLRIDGDGNFLLGKTSANFATAGATLYPSGMTELTRDGDKPLKLNRLTSDGDIAIFAKDGTTVASIGVDGGDNLYLTGQSGNTGGIYMNDAAVSPAYQGTERDAYYDLGKSVARWKNGYFSGTVNATSYTGDGSSLTGIAAGATGGGSDEIFWENGQTVTTNYTISNGKNAMSAGPITINTGVTVTVGTGETWTVV